MISIKAFLLAAGVGSRMGALTQQTPKCLLPIAGKPLLEVWLELLRDQGVTQVLLNTHWLQQQVEAFVSRWQSRNLVPQVTLFHEPTLLGSAGTLLANRKWVTPGKPFLILYADNLTDVPVGRLVECHLQHGLPFTLGVFKADHPTQCGIAEIGEDDIVTGFEEKPEHPKSKWAAAGVYAADDRIFDVFPPCLGEGQTLDLGFNIIPRLVGRMRAYYIRDFLLDIGTPEAYKKAARAWNGLKSG